LFPAWNMHVLDTNFATVGGWKLISYFSKSENLLPAKDTIPIL
jgi:hypothetical protein